jgi:hypothetical protein
MADTSGISIAETDAGNARPPRVIIGGGPRRCGGDIRGTFSAYELQFFCRVDSSARWAGKITKFKQ